jgi:hypothetical protein
MPARPVKDQDELLVWSCSCLAGKGREFGLEEWDAHARGEVDERSARRAMGRCPIGAQMRRKSGLRPMRCSSVAHSSTVARGNAVATCRSKGLIFF